MKYCLKNQRRIQFVSTKEKNATNKKWNEENIYRLITKALIILNPRKIKASKIEE